MAANTDRLVNWDKVLHSGVTVRATDPETSRDAANSLTPVTLSRVRREVYDAVRSLGTATTDECCEAMYGNRFAYRSTVSRRLTDLHEMGLIEPAGSKLAESGRYQQSWKITEGEGRLF